MDRSLVWGIRPNDLTHQNIDGEVIVVDMDSGKYFSLRGAAAPIWECVEAAASANAIAEHLGPERREQVFALLDQLAAENLIEAQAEGAQSGALPAPPSAWEEPSFEAYDDMQALLLADPIHEVDEFGWPQAAPALD